MEVHGKAFSTLVAMTGGVDTLDLSRIAPHLFRWTITMVASDDSQSSSPAEQSVSHKQPSTLAIPVPTSSTAAELLDAWAPDDLRQMHPGYYSDGESGSSSS